MKIQLLRHATAVIEFTGKTILVDPVLSPAGAMNPFPTKRNSKKLKNPLVDIPIEKAQLDQLLNSVDAVLITHTHSDHLDDITRELVSENIQIFCQPEDVETLKKKGFSNIQAVENILEWSGISIIRTECKHGGFLLRRIMGQGSGYLLKAANEKTLYITGDTIWCNVVEETIKQYNPEMIIIYGGAAQLPFGRSITMNEKDIEKVCEISKESQKIILHMEAMNHCLLKRDELKKYLYERNILKNVHIPKDGEYIDFSYNNTLIQR